MAAAAFVAAFVPPLRLLVLGCDLALLAALALERARTPDPARLDLRRSLPARVGLSKDFARRVRVEAGGAAGLELELDEEFPTDFEVRARSVRTTRLPSGGFEGDEAPAPGLARPASGDPSGGPDAARLPASGPLDLVRVYRASRRGPFAFGDVRVRLLGPWGLLWRQARLRATQEVRVEPPLEGLSRTLRLAASERWKDLGVRFVKRRGGQVEFESLREHVHGDDPRLVDWKAFARRGRPIVRQFHEERGQELVIALDCGRRMGARTALPLAGRGARERRLEGWTKLDHALDAALVLAAVALEHGDRVGVLAFDARVLVFEPPARGRDRLARLRDALFDLAPSERESDLARALRELALRHRRRALVLLLGDVADPFSVERQTRALSAAGRRHKLIFAVLDDPALAAAARGELSDGPEGAALRAAALAEERERRAALARLSRSGARVLDALPAELAGPLLTAWLEARRPGFG